MEKQNHIFDELRVIFSQERLDRYLGHAHCNNSKNEALIAYSWNIELSQALYPALQVLEIALRNSLHDTITDSYQTGGVSVSALEYLDIFDQFQEIHANGKEKIKTKLADLLKVD